jgi:hypothetical protein
MAQDSRKSNGVSAHVGTSVVAESHPASVGQAPALPVSSVAGALVPLAPPGIRLVALQRRAATVDPLSEAGVKLAGVLLPRRTDAVRKFYLGVDRIRAQVSGVTAALALRTLPGNLIGVLRRPDGSAAPLVQVEFDPACVGKHGPKLTVITRDDGSFTLTALPSAILPASGLPLVVHGANDSTTLTIPAAQIAPNGVVGAQTLPVALSPLHVSILSALGALQPATPTPTAPSTVKRPGQLHAVKLGEDDTCALSFQANSAVDKFPYGVFFRLIEPGTSIPHLAVQVPGASGKYYPLPHYGADGSNGPSPQVSYLDRVPIEQPLSVDGFRDQLMGIDASGIVTPDETVPMAGTLGLGYTLWLSQRWTFQGLALGDLVYSLALAPGEQQQVAIFERVDTAAVRESESFGEEELRDEAARSDTSTRATFNSAFNEVVNGGSQFNTQATSASVASQVGSSIGIISAGGSGSSGFTASQGGDTEWLQGQRNTTQQAAESTHSAAESHAAARRSAMRTGMRMATASESESVTTRVITNHNHTRALTLQYWEVQRLYDVTTAIDGLTLTCLIPMQVVRFLPPGQPLTLSDHWLGGSRGAAMERYSCIIKHADVLMQALPRRLRYGLTLLQQFAGDPTASVEAVGVGTLEVLKLQLGGTFLPCEDVSISAVTKRNTRIGPVKLSDPAPIPADRYSTREELLAALRSQRHGSPAILQASLALPPALNRADIVGFELTRHFRSFDYTLVPAEIAAVSALKEVFPVPPPSWLNIAPLQFGATSTVARTTVRLGPDELELELGGPLLQSFQAYIQERDAHGNLASPTKNETYANDSLNGVELPPQPYPVPALQLGPVLRFNQVLEIERMVQHVVRNTVEYSKAVWASMSPDERAILLEHYTIGVPADGVADASQMVPLLNCVENRVLGFFGNSMMMPFMIPQAVAEGLGIHSAQLQNTLLSFQRESFAPPQSTIALPTRGVLGEAVLGHCSSAEKVDLTRFWNWADAPSDTAPQISPVTLPTTGPSIAGGLTGPNSLTNLTPLINNMLTAPTPDSALLRALSDAAARQQDFSPDFTGAKSLATLVGDTVSTADAARKSALEQNSNILTKAIDAATQVIKQSMQSYGDIAKASQPDTSAGKTEGKTAKEPSTPSSNPDDPSTKKGKQPPPDDKTPSPGGGTPTGSSPDDWNQWPGSGDDQLSQPPLVSADTGGQVESVSVHNVALADEVTADGGSAVTPIPPAPVKPRVDVNEVKTDAGGVVKRTVMLHDFVGAYCPYTNDCYTAARNSVEKWDSSADVIQGAYRRDPSDPSSGKTFPRLSAFNPASATSSKVTNEMQDDIKVEPIRAREMADYFRATIDSGLPALVGVNESGANVGLAGLDDVTDHHLDLYGYDLEFVRGEWLPTRFYGLDNASGALDATSRITFDVGDDFKLKKPGATTGPTTSRSYQVTTARFYRKDFATVKGLRSYWGPQRLVVWTPPPDAGTPGSDGGP